MSYSLSRMQKIRVLMMSFSLDFFYIIVIHIEIIQYIFYLTVS